MAHRRRWTGLTLRRPATMQFLIISVDVLVQLLSSDHPKIDETSSPMTKTTSSSSADWAVCCGRFESLSSQKALSSCRKAGATARTSRPAAMKRRRAAATNATRAAPKINNRK